MLIITADDYGQTVLATDRILECFRIGSLTCASAMVFMEDSERAAALARNTSLEIGLHLNLTEAFTASKVTDDIRQRHASVVRYLNSHRFAQAIFNPLLVGAFRSLVKAQWAEFERLYSRSPDFVNGHHHMHLCANVLGQRLLPRQTRIRCTFTFKAGDKGRLNRCYRGLVARHLRTSFIAPDCLYSIEPITDTDRLRQIGWVARNRNVELEVHPEDVKQHDFLLDPGFHSLLEGTLLRGFKDLGGKSH